MHRVFDVGADVTHAVGDARDRRVAAPAGQLGGAGVALAQFVDQPLLRVFGVDRHD